MANLAKRNGLLAELWLRLATIKHETPPWEANPVRKFFTPVIHPGSTIVAPRTGRAIDHPAMEML
jgi:hypothetical protein